MADTLTPAPGAEFLGYRLDAPLGQGGMGVVYLASDLRLKRRIALKLIAPELAQDERFRERFAREAELAMSLEHPNVVPIHDAGEVDGRLYLAMRHVEGKDLRTLLREEGPLTPERALAIVRQVAAALDAAHAAGLVHRDVKPSNVLLDSNGHVYLADFGIAREASATDAGVPGAPSLGTPAYLAPEQVESGQVDGRADVYSLGCLLFECLTGEPPFPGGSRLAVIWAHLEEEPPRASQRRPELGDSVDPVIRKAMAKRPEERFETCSELVVAAEEALGVGAPRRRRRRAALLAAAALAVVLAGLAAAAAVFAQADENATGLVVRPNTLVRIDPETNALADVVDLPSAPAEIAVAGRSIWMYSETDSTVSEIDADSGEVRDRTGVGVGPIPLPLTGPTFAADSEGAWLVGNHLRSGRALLTRIRSGGRGTRTYAFGGSPLGIVVWKGEPWVLVQEVGGSLVVQIDPRTGAILRRIELPEPSGRLSSVDGFALGDGAAWVTESNGGTLHRVDLASGSARSADFGALVTPPAFGYGWVWLCAVTDKSRMLRIDRRSLRRSLSRNALPAEDGVFVVGFESLWRHDAPSGTVMRFDTRSGDPVAIVPVLPPGPAGEDLTVTAIAAGADAVWATVAVDGD
jgi:tRNA A-37 threonylcarbamoyl transferase component Bud32